MFSISQLSKKSCISVQQHSYCARNKRLNIFRKCSFHNTLFPLLYQGTFMFKRGMWNFVSPKGCSTLLDPYVNWHKGQVLGKRATNVHIPTFFFLQGEWRRSNSQWSSKSTCFQSRSGRKAFAPLDVALSCLRMDYVPEYHPATAQLWTPSSCHYIPASQT